MPNSSSPWHIVILDGSWVVDSLNFQRRTWSHDVHSPKLLYLTQYRGRRSSAMFDFFLFENRYLLLCVWHTALNHLIYILDCEARRPLLVVYVGMVASAFVFSQLLTLWHVCDLDGFPGVCSVHRYLFAFFSVHSAFPLCLLQVLMLGLRFLL